ncbi:hypothetical protein [Hymenobacter sp. IS2118]|uniref:hypothetical protein n=1 Tax=Hymenobacter sp. IS2118 TaxID=1505605 RepID=UPI00054D5AB5|nr:hypothetical protein [Hymenobacter sp. IS2118]
MKYAALPLLTLGLLFSQCATKAPDPTPEPDYDQQSAQLMQAVKPLVAGDWTLRRVFVARQPLNVGQAMIGIKRDTVFQDFATLSITPGPERQPTPDLRYADFEGTLRFRTKTYPVKFQLIANPERVVEGTGPQAYFLLTTNHPIGSRPTEPEERFLEYIGLVNENFTLEAFPDQPRTITWRGLNRGISRIELVK